LADMHKREDNIKIDFRGIGYRMYLLQYKAYGLVVLNTVINIWFQWEETSRWVFERSFCNKTPYCKEINVK